MKKPIIPLFIILAASLLPLAHAHSLLLYDVSLDFESEYKSQIDAAAMAFFNTTQKPMRYDFDHELIIAHYGDATEKSVAIHPVTFQVMGMKDDTLYSKGISSILTAETAKPYADAA